MRVGREEEEGDGGLRQLQLELELGLSQNFRLRKVAGLYVPDYGFGQVHYLAI